MEGEISKIIDRCNSDNVKASVPKEMLVWLDEKLRNYMKDSLNVNIQTTELEDGDSQRLILSNLKYFLCELKGGSSGTRIRNIQTAINIVHAAMIGPSKICHTEGFNDIKVTEEKNFSRRKSLEFIGIGRLQFETARSICNQMLKSQTQPGRGRGAK